MTDLNKRKREKRVQNEECEIFLRIKKLKKEFEEKKTENILI